MFPLAASDLGGKRDDGDGKKEKEEKETKKVQGPARGGDGGEREAVE